MSEPDSDDLADLDSAEPLTAPDARRPLSAALLGAFGAGVVLIVVLLYLAY